eukprot:357240-Chlamydomonas_euryale.AAC.3
MSAGRVPRGSWVLQPRATATRFPRPSCARAWLAARRETARSADVAPAGTRESGPRARGAGLRCRPAVGTAPRSCTSVTTAVDVFVSSEP